MREIGEAKSMRTGRSDTRKLVITSLAGMGVDLETWLFADEKSRPAREWLDRLERPGPAASVAMLDDQGTARERGNLGQPFRGFEPAPRTSIGAANAGCQASGDVRPRDQLARPFRKRTSRQNQVIRAHPKRQAVKGNVA